MKASDDLLHLADKVSTEDTLIFPNDGVKQSNRPLEEEFKFRPLTEEEKREFVTSLNTDGKRILAQLAGKSTRSDESAA